MTNQKIPAQYWEEELWWICESNDLANYEKLLEDHPHLDLNCSNSNGTPALYCCAYFGGNDVLEMMVRAPSIEINILDSQGNNAFFGACAGNNIKGAKILHHLGCDCNNVNDMGLRAIDIARSRGFAGVVKYIEGLEDFRARNKNEEEMEVPTWSCHLCGKKNELELFRCRICGRPNASLNAEELERAICKEEGREYIEKEEEFDEKTFDFSEDVSTLGTVALDGDDEL